MASSQIQLPDPNNPTILRFQSEGQTFVERASSFVVEDDIQLAEAIDYARGIARAKKTITEFFKTTKQGIDALKQHVLNQERGLLAPFERADTSLRARITVYQTKRDREVREEAARIRREQQRQAEEEQLRRAIELEQMAKTTGDDHYKQAAEATLSAPVTPMPVSVAVAAPPPKGASLREEVSVRVLDLKALAAAVAAGIVEPDAIKANEPWLRREAVQRGEGFNIPGVERLVTKDVTIR